MAETRDLAYINKIRAGGTLEDGRPSFLREWEPVRYLGHGSYGVVYEVRRGSERCAVKIIDMSRPNIDYSVEISALNMLRGQKNAAQIYEYAYVTVNHGGFDDRFLLIRMNLLRDLPESMNEDEVIDLGAQMCGILSMCHGGENKIYHCDIKPENILVGQDGAYTLCDFGASNITQRSHKSSGHAGTPLFEAPEMLRFESFDGRSDLFSLGITMYALLNSGLPPFARNNNDAEAVRLRLEGKKDIPAINGVSPELIGIIRKACAFDADRRYRNAKDMGNALLALARERAERRRKEEEALRKAEEEARQKAERERAERRRKEEEARRRADKAAEDSVFGKTSVPGESKSPVTISLSEPVQKTKRKPFGIIAIAAALVAAIVCGVIWLPGRTKPDAAPADAQNAENAVNANDVPYLSDVTGVSVGDHLYFGSYPQTEAGEEKPIEWRVLDVDDGKALMISEYLLDAKPYNDEFSYVTWETCTLRKWLNEDFYSAAFSSEEQSVIALRNNRNQENTAYSTDGGNDTEDRVFCLSIYEASRYFSGEGGRMAAPTAYAVKRGAFSSAGHTLKNGMKTGWWWLRSPGDNGNHAACVNTDGSIYSIGNYVTGDEGSVRPVVLISLSDVSTAGIAEPSTTNIAIGDHVYFGSYPQTEDGEVQPVEWRVLAVENGSALMISEYLLDVKPYNGELTDVTWETCTLRKWLNEDFYDAAFTAEEKSRIVQRTNENPDNPDNGTEGGNTTKDRVFCLSMDEASRYFSNTTKEQDGYTTYPDRMAKPTAYAKKRGADVHSDLGTGWWWLRSPGYDGSNYAADARYDGGITALGDYVHNGNIFVRPVVLVSL